MNGYDAQWSSEWTSLHAVSVVEVQPDAEPIDLATAKLYARIAGTDLDWLFDTFIRAAREKVEIESGLALLTQTRRVWFDALPIGVIDLPPCCEPLQTVIEFASFDVAGVSHPLDASTYQIDAASHPPRVYVSAPVIAGLRSFQPVTMQLLVGHASIAAIPASLLHACGLLAGFYANESGDRFLAADLWDQYDETIAPYRLVTA
jgi:uncharacterized phiE125 gp8 family phage protein